MYRHELHLHTCFSFLDGASHPEELAQQAKSLGYESLAVTDHDGLYGAMVFAQACKDENVQLQAIIGAEITLRHGQIDVEHGVLHLTLLAESQRGYANLCRIITEAHRHSPKPVNREAGEPVVLDPGFLEKHTEGIIALSGCRLGELARLVDDDRWQDALAAAQKWSALFGPGQFFVELQNNLVYGDTARVGRLVKLANHLGLPIVATGNVHYHDRARHQLQDAMVAVRNRSTLESSHQLRRPNSEFYLRPPAVVTALFAEYPAAIANAAAIAERCRGFDLTASAPQYTLPDFVRKPDEASVPEHDVLSNHLWVKFAERYPPDNEFHDEARVQLEKELATIDQHKLSGFFLIYRDIQELAAKVAQEVRGAGTVRNSSGLPPGRGRGSSVSSIVCHLIGLSHVDPVKHKLFFRRFLNEEMRTFPDIDLDFARDIREQLILRVYDRYGVDNAALVCTYACYHLRSAVRDLGKALGLPSTSIDKLAKLSEGGGADTVRTELERLPEFQGQAEGPLWRYLVDLAEQIDGMPRHVGQHVGGMIISSTPVVEMVPVQPAAMEGRFICQWDKDSCDDARFIKIDFLALGMLSLVEECLEMIWHCRERKLDLSRITYDDPEIYEDICQGDTIGLFQIESRAQIQMLTRTLPKDLTDLAVQVAIVRPGPIVGGAVNPYVRRREMLRRNPNAVIEADHPSLNETLRDTLGVILYQDQVLEVAIRLAGFTPGQADRFRRAMSRRRSADEMEKFRELFVAGAWERHEVPEKQAQEIFDKLSAFSGFGFPKSHAYAFAILAYQSAYLRHYYPAEYYAALFNNQPMGFYAPHVLVGDAQRHGLSILRVSINRSDVRSSPYVDTSDNPSASGVRLGLTSVRGLGEDAARAMVAERDANGPYRSLRDLLDRTHLSRVHVERLIAVGALGEFGLSRRDLFWQLGLLIPRERKQGQLSLGLPVDQDMVSLADMTQWERMIADYGLLDLSPSYHPLGLLRRQMSEDLLTAAQLREPPRQSGDKVSTAGVVVCRQRPGTAKGYVFLLLEDETGLTNVIVKPGLYEMKRNVARGEPYLRVFGELRIDSGSLNLIAETIEPLFKVPAQLMPKPEIRHAYPGNPHDPRERPPHARLPALASHNFH